MTLHAAILLAAIVTDQLGVFLKVPAWVPTKVESEYIPYGTYSGGQGDVEYTRVTSNLTACLISTIDGYVERDLAACGHPGSYDGGYVHADRFGQSFYTVNSGARPLIRDGREYYDDSRVTSSTLADIPLSRWPDIFVGYNAGVEPTESYVGGYPHPWWYAYLDPYKEDEPHVYYFAPCGNELTNTTRLVSQYLANTESNLCRVSEHAHRGTVCRYSSERLRSFAGDSSPISSAWRAITEGNADSFPFSEHGAEDDVRAYPTYEALGYDDIFFPTNDLTPEVRRTLRYPRPHLFKLADYYYNYGFNDFFGPEYRSNVVEWVEALSKLPLVNLQGGPVLMEDVLKHDPGWNYPRTVSNDYWVVNGSKLGGQPVGTLAWASTNTVTVGSRSNVTMRVTISGNGELLNFSLHDAGSSRPFASFDKDGKVGYPYATTHFGFALTNSDDGCSRPFVGTRVTKFLNDDLYHWRNGTTRLDWKRLGIVAQMERQMERSYKVEGPDDAYTRLEATTTGSRRMTYTNATVSIRYAGVSRLQGPRDCRVEIFPTGTWTPVTNAVTAVTNRTSVSSFPTAWSGVPYYGAGAAASFEYLASHYVTEGMVSNVANQIFANLYDHDSEHHAADVIEGEIYAMVDPEYYPFGVDLPWVDLQGGSAGLQLLHGGDGWWIDVEAHDYEHGTDFWLIYGAPLGEIVDSGNYSNLVSAAINLNVSRSIDTAWTVVDSGAATNLYPWAHSNLWVQPLNYIKSFGFEAFEGVAAVTGGKATKPRDDRVSWTDGDPECLGRLYRMSPRSEGIVTEQGLLEARARRMQGLNDGVLAQHDPRGLGTNIASDITDADINRCQRTMRFDDTTEADVIRFPLYRIRFRVPVKRQDWMYTYEVDGDFRVLAFEYTTDTRDVPPWEKQWYPVPGDSNGWLPFYVKVQGPLLWDDYDPPKRTNEPPAKRADGLGVNMTWIDWNFKNLKESTQP